MSSSTSSSEPTARGRKLRIALMLVAALLVLEWGTRASHVPGTYDLVRYRAFPEQARKLATAPATSIAFIGNSVTDRVRLDVLSDEWRSLTGSPLIAEKFVAYDSNLSTWYWMSNQYFLKPGLDPDLIVVTYYETNGLADWEVMEVSNLALFFTDAEDREVLFEHDVTTLEHRADFLMSSVSEAFAARTRIHDRILNFIPGYRPFATKINTLNFEYEKRRSQPKAAPPQSYHTLERFLAGARDAGIKVCFVEFPMRPGVGSHPSDIINPRARELIAEYGMLHLDMRDMDELTADLYMDNVHVNVRGQMIYTRKFVQALSKEWQPR